MVIAEVFTLGVVITTGGCGVIITGVATSGFLIR